MKYEVDKLMKNIKLGTVPSNYKKTKKGNIIPFDWEVKDFYSCVSIVNGQVDPTNPPYIDMKHVGLENIEKHTGRLLFIKTAREEKLTSGKYFFNKGTVLYGKIRPELRKVYYAEFDGICSADIYPLKPKENLYPKFLKYLITDERFYRFAVSASMRTGMPKINRDDIGGYYFLIPKKAEQEQIANILSTWDQAIELKEKLIDEKKKQKTGLMQKLLTGKVRLSGFDKEWVNVKLKKILKQRNEKSEIKEGLELYSLTIEDGVTPKTDRYNREFLVKSGNKKYKITKCNDIVYNPANLRFGAIAVNRIGQSVLLSPIYEVLYIKDEKKYDIDFVGQLLTWNRNIKYFSTMAEGTLVERMAVKIDAFLDVAFKFPPSLEEQKAIASILSLADKEICILKKEVISLKKQKKGLMQLLLTGIIRVNTQENERGDTVRRVEAYDEMNISQIPALEVLNKIGYTIISPEKAEQMRGNLYNVVLKDILYERLTAINSFEFKGCTYKFSEKNIQQAILDIDEALTDGLIKTNEKIYDSLILGRSYPESLSEMDGTKSFNLNYIDWENPENNVFHVVEEFSVEREDGQGTVRPDIVTFINGIPFGVIECKKASISISQGISQMLRNQGKEYIPQLFKFVQIVMVTNKNETQYATTGTPKKFWSLWKEDKESIEYKWFEETLAETVTCRIPTVQDKNIISLFHPKRVIEIIRFFTLYDKNIKKIARYQQYFAIKEIIRTIVETDRNGNRQSGVIWHTQGSGKSLTMVMLSRYILSQFADIHPQVLVITDRIELDSQIHQTFNHSRLRAERAISGRHLVELINNNGADIITSLVHKFDTASKHQKPVKSKNIFVLIDESHRTQYGELNIKMKKVFPNACYLGFTGTPLMKKDKSTMKKFGGRMIHKYTIKDGVEDGAIVPLLYEGRLVEQTVNRNAIDKRIEMITRNLTDKQAEELKKKWSKFEAIASSEQRIRLIADDIYVHYTKFYKDTFAKAMLATASKFDAIRYKESFDEYGDLKTAIVISPPDQREGYDEVDEEPKDRVLKFWNKMMEAYSDPQKYEDHIKSEFIDGDELEILIVVDKLLTGFDAPRASVLYVDKPMKEHTLLQAIARVNRLYEGKDFGLIVDYRGLIQELDSAMRTYSGAGLENFDGKDLEGALVDVISIVGKLRESYSNVVAIFKGIKNKQDKEEYELLLGDEALRNDFYNQLSNFGKYLGIALESEHVYNAIGEEDIKLYKREFKFYQELRASVKLRYSDTIDHKEYEAKMRNLMDTYIAAEDIIQITAPVDILNEKEFEDELMRLGSPRAKADAIRTRMTKRISEKWDENPAYYKKFSERIEEIIEQYKEKRISELEYLEKMRNVMNDFRKGYSGTTYPEKIKHNIHAQAFYGVVKEVLEDERYYEAGVTELVAEDGPIYNYEGILADIAMEVDVIIERHCKVDWHDNPDVHKKISQEIDELLYLVKKKHFPKMTFDQIDTMIENIKTVALRRY